MVEFKIVKGSFSSLFTWLTPPCEVFDAAQ